MTKSEFLNKLKKALPNSEVEERVAFYSEMIDDRIEEGLSEEEAVAEVGDVDAIILQIRGELPTVEKKKGRKAFSAWEIVLLVLGAPLWIPLLIAVFSVVLSIYIVLWSAIISLWSVFASLIGCALGGLIGGAVLAFFGFTFSGVALIGAGLVCAGLAIFAFFACTLATKGAVFLTKMLFTRRGLK